MVRCPRCCRRLMGVTVMRRNVWIGIGVSAVVICAVSLLLWLWPFWDAVPINDTPPDMLPSDWPIQI